MSKGRSKINFYLKYSLEESMCLIFDCHQRLKKASSIQLIDRQLLRNRYNPIYRDVMDY